MPGATVPKGARSTIVPSWDAVRTNASASNPKASATAASMAGSTFARPSGERNATLPLAMWVHTSS